VQDDIVPLLKPITLPNGTVTDHVFMPKGTDVSIQTEVMNCARALWGEDAAVFRPSRWMEPLPEGAQAMAGYRHLATFLDGPKVYVRVTVRGCMLRSLRLQMSRSRFRGH
jgi:hypothetical protein